MKEIFNKLILPIKRKIFLLIGRGILAAVNNSESTQKIQITSLNDETITDIERFQEYGFESYPKADAEVLTLFINGNRDHGISICVHDRTYRPTDLVEGEVMMYHFDGNTKVHIKQGEIHITGGGTLEFAPLASKIKDIVDAQIMDIFNSHVHSGVTAGGANTAISTTQMTKPPQTDYESEEVKIS